MEGRNIQYRLVHTGQHYDDKLSQVFFEELRIPAPDVNLGVGSGTQAQQTARIMVEFEKDLSKYPTDLVLVVGDVNSTMACTIVAKKSITKVAHVEGGIRSWDMTMPEEINRIVTDSLADYFFTTSRVANENLVKSGITPNRIFFVGNTMIDSLLMNLSRIKKPKIWNQALLNEKEYYVLTLHRPSNVDDPNKLGSLIRTIDRSSKFPIIFPAHPRTNKNLEKVRGSTSRITVTDSMSYLEFIFLVKNSRGVITDSGGIQEETTILNIPCLTLRNSTERPETVSDGTNLLIGDDFKLLNDSINTLNIGGWKTGRIPELWDGKASERIVGHFDHIK
jgi:UDP-N-acetylglucosamine 2-epimerase (non-hydrolysing)